jgi:transposase InsO family protein
MQVCPDLAITTVDIYTSIKFQDLITKKEVRQSMSRRGNCWDNAPQESFLGHMKDEMQHFPRT